MPLIQDGEATVSCAHLARAIPVQARTDSVAEVQHLDIHRCK